MVDVLRQTKLFRRRLLRARFLQLAFGSLTGFLLAYGVLILIVRAFLETRLLLLGLALIPALLLFAFRRADRQTPERDRLLAHLDLANHRGGLMMASVELPGGAWPLAPTRLPAIYWNPVSALWRFLAAALFFTVCLAAPVHWVTVAPTGLAVEKQTSSLAEQIAALEEVKVIEESESERLKRDLTRIAEDAVGTDPAKTWEALDHLERSLGEKARSGADQMEAEAAALENLKGLADFLQKGAPDVPEQTRRDALAELAALVQAQALENRFLAANLDPELAEKLAQSGDMQMQELLKLLKAASQSAARDATKLEQARLLRMDDFKALQRCKNPKGARENSELAAFLAELESGSGSGSGRSLQICFAATGEAQRGRGDAEMTWTDGTSEENAKFIPTVLTLGELSALEQSQTIGMSAAAPETTAASTATFGALAGAKSGSGSAHTQQLLPRHRGAVKRYFQKQ